MTQRYNGCPDSEVLAEYFKRFVYDENRKEEILNKFRGQRTTLPIYDDYLVSEEENED